MLWIALKSSLRDDFNEIHNICQLRKKKYIVHVSEKNMFVWRPTDT